MMKQMAGQFGFGSRSATKRLAKSRKGKKGAKGKPAARQGPRGLPAGMPDLSALPPSLRELPPGLGGAGPAAAGLRPVEAEVPQGQVARVPPPGQRCSARTAGATAELYVDDGRPGSPTVRLAGAETLADGGFLVPGLVDAHCHVGIGPRGAVPLDEADARRRRTGTPGTLLIRDCGSPVDTRPLQGRAGPAGDRPGRPAPRAAQALHPGPGRRARRPGAAARRGRASRRAPATAGSSWSATGSTGRSATSPRCGRTTCWRRRSTPRTPRAPGSPRTSSGRTRCPG